MTHAFFTDLDSSHSNTVDGGVLDVKLSETGAATEDSTLDETHENLLTDTWDDSAHADAESVNNTVTVENDASSLAIERTNLTVSYTERDGASGTGGNARETAKSIRVRTFRFDGTELVGTAIRDENGNSRIDVDDLVRGETAQNLSMLSGIGPGDTGDLTIAFDGNSTLMGDSATGEGIDVRIDLRGHRVSFLDADRSEDNTIIYE